MQIPRPEYPRPQLVRQRWINLNGVWEFEFDPGLSGIDRGLAHADRLAGEIIVPFCAESALSGVADVDFHAGVWYRREFAVRSDWEEGRVLLHVGACDHDTTVWVNGELVGTHRGGYTPFQIDITAALKRGQNVLTIHARDDTRSPWVLSGKQCPDYYSRRCHYTRTTGLWQTVWLEPVPETYIADLRLTPLVETGQLLVEATLGGKRQRGVLRGSASLSGEVVARREAAFGGQHATLILNVPEARLWSPGVLHPLNLPGVPAWNVCPGLERELVQQKKNAEYAHARLQRPSDSSHGEPPLLGATGWNVNVYTEHRAALGSARQAKKAHVVRGSVPAPEAILRHRTIRPPSVTRPESDPRQRSVVAGSRRRSRGWASTPRLAPRSVPR